MSYVYEITEPLIRTLSHTAGLPAPQLAGHAANLTFWVGEVHHALHVIDGYRDRFARLQEGERSYLSTAAPRFMPYESGKPLRAAMTDSELKELRRRVLDPMRALLRRCYKERLLSDAELESHAEGLGFDPRDLMAEK